MRIYSKLVIGLALLLMGCTAQTEETYIPSIAALEENETLVMKFSDCHYGCENSTVRFKNKKAILGRRSLNLTPQEINELDRYFLSAPVKDEDYFCSALFKISFKQKRGLRVLNAKDVQQYACRFEDDASVNPWSLINNDFRERGVKTPLSR